MNAIFKNGRYDGFTYYNGLEDGRRLVIIETIKEIHTYEASGEVNAEGRPVLVHKSTVARWREGKQPKAKGQP
jgi:hypothetical protein